MHIDVKKWINYMSCILSVLWLGSFLPLLFEP